MHLKSIIGKLFIVISSYRTFLKRLLIFFSVSEYVKLEILKEISHSTISGFSINPKNKFPSEILIFLSLQNGSWLFIFTFLIYQKNF